MDTVRFDTLVRAWTTPGSRRAVLRGLATGALAGLLGRDPRVGSAAPAPKGGSRRHAQSAALGRCIAPVATPQAGCLSDADCPAEQVCSVPDAACVPPCRTDPDCAVGRRCLEDQCVEIACAGDADCPAELVCAVHIAACVPACADDTFCASDQTCVDGGCVETGCATDDDCAAGQVCRVPACDWTGTWSTNWGEMRLVQDGGVVRGDYDWDQGQIDGTLDGEVLRGMWTEVPSRQPPRDAGDLEFTMAEDCQSFTGRWRYGSSEGWRQRWDGERRTE